MGSSIFISYRRSESAHPAGRIYQRLSRSFGARRLFMDVDTIQKGRDFREALDEALTQCRVMLVLVGPGWLDVRDETGERRLADPSDFVRLEIGTALERRIVVIPVCLDGAELPDAADLPDDLKEFVSRQGMIVSHGNFARDMDGVEDALRPHVRRKGVMRGWAAALVLFLIVCVLLLTRLSPPSPQTNPVGVDDSTLEVGQAFRDCSVCPEMVVLPPGDFTMGSPESEAGRNPAEGPRHRVRLTKAFAVGKYEITVKQYEDFVAATGGVADGGGCAVWTAYGARFGQDRSFKTPSFSQGSSHPVVCVSWQAALTYANWLTTRTGKKYRLPSEAEWEYAIRAGSDKRYFFGDSEASLCEFANGADRTSAFLWGNHLCSDGVGVQTAEVGKYKPNAFGLHDMLGNAAEWVYDCWHANYDGAPTDGSPWMGGDCGSRVIRGGSWENSSRDMRSATRGAHNLKPRDTIGFRVAREIQ